MTEYNIDYLNSLIENKVEENLNLDYKAAGSLDKQNNKTTEISKDVSAFANSDGGILIYGIKEDKVNKHLPEKIDPINRKDFTKEWLEQIIQDKIRPRISDFKIHPIEINNEQVVYVVDIKKSNTAHQAFDKKYYKRYNFQSTSMYDYEIRDILNRAKNPEIELDFELKDRHSTLVVYAVNIGRILAKYLNVDFKIPKQIIEGNEYSPFNKMTFETYNLDNTIRDVLDVEFTGLMQVSEKYGPSRYEPILPNRRFKLTEIKIGNHPFDDENYLEWEIFCDNANPKKGTVKMNQLLNK
ncbi:AlbA family DNA-binding domain-containing protein [Dokdonia donghaensis]|uniref:AlbA family DNA-binding domain-containing protein n=1 Tax=Dokdonia donghaensis TaxID=326320 RepID=UPI00068BA58B|nr:ATP-binding protein [Dokdonia donghaensis]ANH61435.1 Divergent AAA domain protein [Dokdonia donghaensis DSW-1]